MSTDPLTNLRLSDPARTVPPLTEAQLAERRAAIPTPAVALQPARRRGSGNRRTMAVVLAAALAAGSVAVAAGYRPWQRDDRRTAGPGTAQPDVNAVVQREFTAATNALSLPPGVEWNAAPTIPADTIVGTGRGGQGESSAVLYALNAWECELVDATERNDPGRVAAAGQVLQTMLAQNVIEVPPGTPEDGAAPSGLPGPIVQTQGSDVIRGWIRDAIGGDITNLRDSCRANRPTP
jgi:hypothetical protein